MSRWPPHLYRQLAAQRGLSSQTTEAALSQAQALQARNLPVILTLGHLAYEADVAYDSLRSAATRQSDPYRQFRLRKRSGGWRHICIPHPQILRVQRWISDHILQRLDRHPAAMAYGPGCSPASCAAMHCGCRWLIKIDVQQFFESISEIQAFRVFRDAGYNALVSFEMARLCTRVLSTVPGPWSPAWRVRRRYKYPANGYRDRRIGYLPQGAGTSPVLANLAVKAMDAQLSELAEAEGMTYTRYSDDLAFSTASDFSRDRARAFIWKVYRVLMANGLRPHTAKTVVAPPGTRKTVLGLLVDRAEPSLSRTFKARLETQVHCLCIAGPTEHAKARGFRSVKGMRRHVEGLVAHAASVDEAFANRMRQRLATVQWPL